MSNDLISRSALLEDFRNTITERSDTFDWLNMINRQSTAYDVDKVMEQMEKDILELKDQLMYTTDEDMAVRLRCKMHGLDRAIEIVKEVGVNENN